MNEYLSFEDSLYLESPQYEVCNIADLDFLVDNLVSLPSLRPFCLDRLVKFCCEFCKSGEIRAKILEKSMNKCLSLLYRLYKANLFSFDEIDEMWQDHFVFRYYCFFHQEFEITDMGEFFDSAPQDIDLSFVTNTNDFDVMKLYGYLPSSLEYWLKYDDSESLIKNIVDFSTLLRKNVQWSPFEWSREPSNFDVLSFSGFFGSIHCFKHLLLNGFTLNNAITESVICSGSIDLFRLCPESTIDLPSLLVKSSTFHHTQLLTFLLEQGSSINSQDKNGRTPLHAAASEGHLSVVSFLIQNGAEVNIKGPEGNTPLLLALMNKHTIVSKYLLDNGSDITLKNDFGWSPLHISISNHLNEISKQLLSLGANVNDINIHNVTPLHVAADHTNYEMAKILVDSQAIVDSKDKYLLFNLMILLHFILLSRGVLLRLQICLFNMELM